MSSKNFSDLIISKLKSHYDFKSDTALAKFLGISLQGLQSWRERDSLNIRLVYAKCVGLNANWLLTGEGDMFLENKDSYYVDDINKYAGKTEEMLKLYAKIEEQNKELEKLTYTIELQKTVIELKSELLEAINESKEEKHTSLATPISK